MNTELLIDAAIIILAFLYLGVARCMWREIKESNRHNEALEKTARRAQQLREHLEAGKWT